MESESQDIRPESPLSLLEPQSLKDLSALDFSISTATLSVPKHFKRRGHTKGNRSVVTCDRKYRKMATPNKCASANNVNTLRRTRQPSVAIATQVLNPRSLKGHGVTRRFGRRCDEEEEGLFTYRQRRATWKKLCYYGTGVAATILVLMGFVLAVGYFQSEKHRKSTISTRSVKLIQERRPLSYIYTSTPPPSLEMEPTDSQEFLPTTDPSFFESSQEAAGGFDFENESGEQFHNSHHYHHRSRPQYKSFDSSEIERRSKESNETNSEGENGRNENVNKSDDDDEGNDSNDRDYIVNYDWEGFNEFKQDRGQNETGTDSIITEIGDNLDDHSNSGSSVDYDTGHDGISTVTNSTSESENVLIGGVEKEEVTDQNNEIKENGKVFFDQSVKNVTGDDTIEKTMEMTEVKVEASSHSDSNSIVSIEIPIYKRNKTKISSGLYELQEESSAAEASEQSQTEGGDNAIEMTSVEGNNNNDQVGDSSRYEVINGNVQDRPPSPAPLQLIIKEVNRGTKEVIRGNSEIENEQGNKGSRGNNDDQTIAGPLSEPENFHRSVLQTALFHSDEEVGRGELGGGGGKQKKFSARLKGRIRIGDGKLLSPKPSPVPFPLERIEPRRKNINLIGRRGRIRKIKTWRNENISRPSSQGQGGSRSREKIRDDGKADFVIRKPGGRERFLQKEDRGIINEKIDVDRDDNGGEWESSTQVTHFGPPVPFAERDSRLFSSTTVSPPKDQYESMDYGEQPRLFSSSPSFSSSFEAFLRNILKQNENFSEKQTQSHNQNVSIDPPTGISNFGSSFVTSINQFVPPPPPQQQGQIVSPYTSPGGSGLSSGGISQGFSLDPAQLRLHPALGFLGSASSVGASLNNNIHPYQFPSPTPASFSYDIRSSGTGENHGLNVAPGVVPLDLAASYVTPSLTLPKIGLTATDAKEHDPFYRENQFASTPAASTSRTPGAGSPFLYPFNPDGSGVGTLTTLSGQPPTYNTISQGIHLLNMISGVVPNTFYHDQVYSPTTPAPTSSSVPTGIYSTGSLNPFHSVSPPANFHFPNVSPHQTATSNNFNGDEGKTGSETSRFPHSQKPVPEASFPLYHNPPPPPVILRHPDGDDDDDNARFENDYSVYATSFKGDYETETDQNAAASSSKSSSSQLTPAKLKSEEEMIPSSSMNSYAVVEKPPNSLKTKADQTPTLNEPTSFSFAILPKRKKETTETSSGNAIDETLNRLNADIIHSSLDKESPSSSRSRKKSGAMLQTSVEMGNELIGSSARGINNMRRGKVLKLNAKDMTGKKVMKEKNAARKLSPGKEMSEITSDYNDSIGKTKGSNRRDKSGLQSGFYEIM